MSAEPTISTIIPVYNGAIFLRDAVGSVQQQGYARQEIIVVDDGSTDGTAKVAASFGSAVRYVHQANRGLPGARNRGLEEAQGDLVAFLDVDDLWTEDKLSIQLAHLTTRPSLDIVLGRTQKMQMLPGAAPDRPRFKPWAEPEVALSMGTALFKREVFDRVGRFAKQLRFSCDWDWFMRARELGITIGVHDEVVYYYRRHEDNMTEQVDEDHRDTLRMLKRSLGRRRQSNPDRGARSLPDMIQLGALPARGAHVPRP